MLLNEGECNPVCDIDCNVDTLYTPFPVKSVFLILTVLISACTPQKDTSQLSMKVSALGSRRIIMHLEDKRLISQYELPLVHKRDRLQVGGGSGKPVPW